MIIAIIGPDGSGKTTQAKMLVDQLKRDGCNVDYVHVYDLLFDIFRPLRKIKINKIGPRNFRNGHSKNNKTRSNFTRLFIGFFGIIYATISYIYIAVFLSNDKTVICDRYFYQFFFDLFGNYAEKIAKIFPRPDKTFLLHGTVEQFYSQMTDPIDKTFSNEYYGNLIKFYGKLSTELDFVIIDATNNKNEINQIIYMEALDYMRDFHG